jgi:uncharacterized protein
MGELTVNVAQLMREEMGARRELQLTAGELRLDDELVLRNISARVRLTRTAPGIFVKASVLGTVQLTCVRSLEQFDYALKLEFADQFYAVVDVVTGAKFPPPVEDDPFMLDELHQADLGAAIRQYALIELPLNPVAPAYRDTPISYTVESEGVDEDPVADDRLAALREWAERRKQQ